MKKVPNILFIMCDQLRFDALGIHGNPIVRTPNFDRLARRGIDFSNAYSTCPVCIPARMTIRTGCEPARTGIYENEMPRPMDGQHPDMRRRCGPYLAEALREQGYRTFGVGKFHHLPEGHEEIGYEDQVFAEETMLGLWQGDHYAEWIRREHSEFDFIEQLNGERTEMYYMPQTSPLPAELTSESYVADRALELMSQPDPRPWFGFVSFVGPHPPCAPPVPYNRMYNPDIISNPVKGDLETDQMDEQIRFMNYAIWADEINDFGARSVKARYYGEISYIDHCLGRILDAVDRRPDKEETVILFCSDHGDHLGDHHAWQKESYFEQSCHIPLFLSWPERLPAGEINRDLVCHADLFGLLTAAAGQQEERDGADLWGQLFENARPRQELFAVYGRPGTPLFKCMVRKGAYKYIYFSNGGKEQLFQLDHDSQELENLAKKEPDRCAELRAIAAAYCQRDGLRAALDEGGELLAHPETARPLVRIHQFGIPENDFTVTRNR